MYSQSIVAMVSVQLKILPWKANCDSQVVKSPHCISRRLELSLKEKWYTLRQVRSTGHAGQGTWNNHGQQNDIEPIATQRLS